MAIQFLSRSSSSQKPSSHTARINRAEAGPKALPKRCVIETCPSSAGYEKRSSRSPIFPPPLVRLAPAEFTAADTMSDWVASVTACWAETSTCWPRPERRR
jgi:hypothetical protein